MDPIENKFNNLKTFKIQLNLQDKKLKQEYCIKYNLQYQSYIQNYRVVYVENQQQYDDAIYNQNVTEFFLENDIINSETYLDIFMKILFANNQCCNQNEYLCAICSNYVQPENYCQIVKECLFEMLQNEEFQKLCQKLFQKKVQEVDSFLEQFIKINKKKNNNISIINQPISKIIQGPQELKYINITIPSLNQEISLFIQQNPYSDPPTQQLPPQSIIIPQQEINQTQEINKSINNFNQSSKIQPQSQIQQSSKLFDQQEIKSELDFSIYYKLKENQKLEFYTDTSAIIWISIKNNGKKRWPDDVQIMQLKILKKNCIYVSSLKPNEEKSVKLSFQTSDTPGEQNSEWALFYKDDNKKEKRIGSIFSIKFKVKDQSFEKKVLKYADYIKAKNICNLNKNEIQEEVLKILQIQPDLNREQVLSQFEQQYK
ncbi:unnamed protein product [Paramecium primaurelia]|uniref:Uncharacterized protein n=1 Tax=Paramecium primaurelia TaxID=5886 RepID=A0A8S1Q728_PARPR|nr:unnamed protein product [Paramecium primaurelia]